MTSNFDWFLKKVYDRVDSLKDTETGVRRVGSFGLGNDFDNYIDISGDKRSGVGYGGNGNDVVIGDGADITEGNYGDDILIGRNHSGVGSFILGAHDERGRDILIAEDGNAMFRGGSGINDAFTSGKNNGTDLFEVFDVFGKHDGFTRVHGFNSDEDKIALYLGTRDRELTFTTGIQSPSDTGNFFIRDNARGTSLMFQSEGSATASRVMFFEGGANITADSFVGAEIS